MSADPAVPATHSFEDVSAGDAFAHEYAMTDAVYGGFLDTFDDRSPVHVDDAYARGEGFPARVMHGAILNGFLSHFIGMHFPGSSAVLLSVELRYLRPSFLGDRLRLELTVGQKLDAHRALSCTVVFQNLTQACTVANGRVQVQVRR